MAEAFLLGVGGGGPSTVLSAVTLSSNGVYEPSMFSVDGFSTVTVSVTSGDEDDVTLYLEGRLPSYYNSTRTSLSNYAFYGQSLLSSVSIPNLESIGTKVFYYCSSLEVISFPKLNSMTGSCFSGCYNVKYLSLPLWSPSATSRYIQYNNMPLLKILCTGEKFALSKTTFYTNYFLESINISATVVDGSAFYIFSDYNISYSNSTLKTIILPNCSSIAEMAFSSCIKLARIECPTCTYVGYSAFMRDISLSHVEFNALIISVNAFYSCTSLETVILSGSLSSTNAVISTSAFANCTRLKSLYIYYSFLISLNLLPNANNGAFYNTPMTNSSYLYGQYGSIFVLSSMLNTYKTANNWSLISDRIVSIED